MNNSNSTNINLLMILSCLFTVLIIISNLIAIKLIQLPLLPNTPVPCGLLCYPFTFLISDLVTEIYGEKQARLMVYVAFIMSILSCLFIQLAIYSPTHPEWVNTYHPFGYADTVSYQSAFQSFFGLNLFTLASSMAAYILSQILDIRLFAFFKQMTHSRHLWLRNVASTLTSQITDTLIVNLLLLYCALNMEMETVIRICIACYCLKALFTIFSIPLFYGLVNGCRYLIQRKQLVIASA